MIMEHVIEIMRPPQAVFDSVADPESWRAIDPDMLDVFASGPMRLGASGSVRHRRPVTAVTTQWEVTAFEVPERFETLITGFGYTLRETVELKGTDRGTRMSATDVLLPTSLIGRLLVLVSGRIIRSDLQARSDRLKALLEADDSRLTGRS